MEGQDPEIELAFECTIAHIYPDVWNQKKTPFCIPLAAAQMVTILYRQFDNKYKDLVLSPQELINLNCTNTFTLQEYLVGEGFGLHDVRNQPYVGTKSSLKPTGMKYKIGGLKCYFRKNEIAIVLARNFSRRGSRYPIIGGCSMYCFSTFEAWKATKNKPFVRKVALKDGMDRESHEVLIVAAYVESVNPLKVNVQFKNTWGPNWGDNGLTWVTSDFFEDIDVPDMMFRRSKKRKGSEEEEAECSRAQARRSSGHPVAPPSDPAYIPKLESLIAKDAKEAEIQALIGKGPGVILRCICWNEARAQKVFQGSYENAANASYVGAHLAMLSVICDVSKLVFNQLTSWVIYSDEDSKFNKDITIGLIRRELLNLAEYNLHMAKLLDAGKKKVATEFAISLIQTLVAIDARLATRPDAPEGLQQLVEIARNPAAGLPAGKDDFNRQQKDKKVANQPVASRDDTSILELSEPDPAAFQEQVSMVFADWYKIYELPFVNDQVTTRFVLQLQQNGLLKADDTSDWLFCLLLEIAVSHCISSEGAVESHQQTLALSFLAIDMYMPLVFLILKLEAYDYCIFIQKDADEKKLSFNPRPYFRLFINWLLYLGTPDPVFKGANFQVLTALATSFHALQPLKVPAFSFVWLELVSHRSFMPKLLSGNGQKGWPYFQRLLVGLFQFMEPFFRNAELGEPVCFLFKGTLRVLLVLLHDFPEFLCDYHFSFCDIIPPSCIQMRNIILCAFPRNMMLPDPSTPNLKIDLLADISQSPRILSEVDAALKAKQIKTDVDEYFKFNLSLIITSTGAVHSSNRLQLKRPRLLKLRIRPSEIQDKISYTSTLSAANIES